MEAVRPQVDAYVLDWIMQQPLRREWFFEQRDGNCRLMAPFAVQLAETAPTLARAVAPIAEWAAHVLWSTTKRRNNQVVASPTRLTQSHKRETRGSSASLLGPTPPPQRICRGGGSPIRRGRSYCPACAVTVSTENMLEIAKAGRAVSHAPEAESRRAQALRRNVAAQQTWAASGQSGPDDRTYDETIRPRLAGVANSALASALGVSLYYAAEIRRGKRRPHQRHWQALARLAGVSVLGH